MADRVGGDAKKSFDSMIEGIANGRERTLKQLPLNFANIEKAVEQYATAIDKQTSELSEAEKQEALRQAVLLESQRILAESGEIENDFADDVKAGAVQVQNYTDRLAEQIAKHGPMIAGLGGMAQAAATLSPLLGMTGLAGAASALAGVLLSPVGLVAAIGAAAFAFTHFKVSDLEDKAEALERAAGIIGRGVREISDAQKVIDAFEAGKAGTKLTGAITLDMADAWRQGATEAGKFKEATESLRIDGFNPTAAASRSYAAIVKQLRAEIEKLPQATLNEIEAMKALGRNEEQIAAKTGVSVEKQRLLVAMTREGAKAMKESEKEAADMKRRLEHEADARASLQRWMHQNQQALNEYTTDKANEQLAIQMRQLDANTEAWFDMLRATQTVNGLSELPGLKLPMPEVPELPPTFWQKAFGDPKQFGAALTSSIMGALQGGGNLGKTIGGFLGGGVGKGLGETLAATLTSKLGGVLGGMLGPLGAIGGQLIGGLFDKMFSKAGRNKVEEFAATFGGFDALRDKLTLLGDEGERLWINLTQRVGKGNVQQAQAAIDAVTAAFDRQKTKITETGQAAKDAAQAEVDAQQKVIDEIKGRREELAREIADLTKRIDAEAYEDEIGIQEQRDRAERDRLLERQRLIDEELAQAEAKQADNVKRLGDAIKALADALEKLTDKTWKIPIEFDYQNAPPPASGEGGEMPEHADGAYIRRDHVATVHSGELIGPVDFMTRALSGALANMRGGGGMAGGTVILQIGDREFARFLMPAIAGEVKRLRLV
jgi:hypothetical protein